MENELLEQFIVRDYSVPIARLKKVCNMATDRDLSNAIGISPSQLSAMKKKNTFPYKNFIDFAFQNKISLDYLFGFNEDSDEIGNVNNYKKCSTLDDNNLERQEDDNGFLLPYYSDEKKTIKIDLISQDDFSDSLRVVKQNNHYFIIDTSDLEVKNSGIYALIVNRYIIIKEVKINVSGVLVRDPYIYIDRSEGETLRFEDFELFKSIGRVKNIISVDSVYK